MTELTASVTEATHENGSPFEVLRPKAEIIPDSMDPAVLTKIRTWIADCVENHARCARVSVPRSILTGMTPTYEEIQTQISTLLGSRAGPVGHSYPTRLPTRVLDLGIGPHSMTLRLKQTGPNESGTYIALSHCWGSQGLRQAMKTTKESFQAHMEGIEWHALSQTFQDAIIITRELGIQFLWIDSLCIVQGDKWEWEIESAKMERVYSQAYLVIAATAAANGDFGCCFSPPPSHKILVTDRNYHTYSIRIRESTVADHFEGSDFNGNRLTTAFSRQHPLLLRAWALQERLLGHRVLHYCRREIIAECKTGVWCECSGSSNSLSNSLRIVKTHYNRESTRDSGPARLDLTSIWNAVLHHYMNSELAYHSDRLVAISSIATELSTKGVLGQYFAGHWEKDMVRSLFWRSLPHVVRGERDTKDHISSEDVSMASTAPSWSWSSSLYSVEFFRSDGALYYTAKTIFLGCECRPQNVYAPFGSVSKGELILQGPVIEAAYDSEQHAVLGKDDRFECSLSFGPDDTLVFSPDRRTPTSDMLQGMQPENRVYCLWIYSCTRLVPRKLEDCAIVLQKVMSMGESSTYRRIGILQHDGYKQTRDSDRLRRIFSKATTKVVTII
jgi:hypothetical protein